MDEPRAAHDEVDNIEEAKLHDYPGNSYKTNNNIEYQLRNFVEES